MAQDTGLFSVRRPRETLGGINNNISAIPMPSSAMKRSNSISNMQQPQFGANHARSTSGSRMSLAPGRPNQQLFQRSSSGTNLADMGFQSVQRHSTVNIFASGSTGARKSLAPGAMGLQTPAPPMSSLDSTQRRSSVFKTRPSAAVGPTGGHMSFFQTAPLPSGVPTDPRRLRDASTRQQMAAELMEYLTQNNFEMESKHSLSNKAMTSPTQKDFNCMFEWLARRIDKTYRLQRSIDQEVPILLKQLRYPFEKAIMKSQIAAVGGNNWPTFLGVLHWMMQLAKMMELYEAGEFVDACLEAGYDVTGDRIIFKFLSGAYRAWLSADDEDDDEEAQARLVQPFVEQMAREFDRANQEHLDQVKILEAEHKNLQDQIDELSKSAPRIAKLEEQNKVLEEDRGKFEAYNNNMEAKVKKYTDRCVMLDDEIKKIEAQLEESERERQELQEMIDERGMTIGDIDRMASERDRLDKAVEAAETRLEESRKRVAEKELAASRKLDELEQIVERYNSLGYQIGVIPNTAANAKGLDYELIITVNEGPNFSGSQMGQPPPESGDRLLADSGTGYQPHHLLNLDLRGTVKSNIIALRKEISERRNRALEEDMKNHDLLDRAKEAIDEKKAEVEALQHRVHAMEEEFEKTRELTNAQKMTSDAQIERMEKELAKMRASLSESVQVMEQREMSVNIEYEQLTLRAAALREELHTAIEHILDEVIRFKMHIQTSLDDYAKFTEEEVGRSCKELGLVEEGEEGQSLLEE